MHGLDTQPVRDKHRSLFYHSSRVRVHTASQRQAHAPHDPSRMAPLRAHQHPAVVRLGQAVRSPRRRPHMRLLVRSKVPNIRDPVRLLSSPCRHDYHLYKHLSCC